MERLMAFLAALAPLATIASTALTAAGTIAAGNAAAAQGEATKNASEYQAKQLEAQGKEQQAEAQVQAQQLGRQKRLALSSLTTNAAASGFSATDPTALALSDEIAKYGTLQEQTAMYGGARARQGLETNAAGQRYSGEIADILGKSKQSSSYLSAAGTILGGVSTMAGRYGGALPQTGPTAGRVFSSPYFYG
jgi:hypothetical protein